VAIVLPLADLSGLPADRRDREAVRLAGAEGMRPFDLALGPLLRATLLRLQGGKEGEREPEHALLLNLHHITSDGWSTGVLVREMAALYTAHASGAAGSPGGGSSSPGLRRSSNCPPTGRGRRCRPCAAGTGRSPCRRA